MDTSKSGLVVVVRGELAELMAQPGTPPHLVDGYMLDLE
jgi:hypothetical protein